jgi:hypothetical protein
VQIIAKNALRWCLHGIRGARLESVKVVGQPFSVGLQGVFALDALRDPALCHAAILVLHP